MKLANCLVVFGLIYYPVPAPPLSLSAILSPLVHFLLGYSSMFRLDVSTGRGAGTIYYVRSTSVLLLLYFSFIACIAGADGVSPPCCVQGGEMCNNEERASAIVS